MRATRRAGVVALLTASAGGTRWAHAEEPGDGEGERAQADLVYDAGTAPGCPDASSFTHLVGARLGYDPFVTGSDRLLSVKIEERPEGLVGTVWLEDARGAPRRRSMTAGHGECASLAEALATAVGIALDPLFQPPAPPPAPLAPPPEPTPAPLPAPPLVPDRPPTPPAPPSAETPAVRFRAHAGPATAFGLMPGPTLGVAVGAGVRFQSVSVVVEGRLDALPAEVELDSGDRVEAASLTAGPTLCLHVSWWLGCGTSQLGAFQSTSQSVARPAPSGSFSARLGFGTGAELELSPQLGLRFLAELGVPLVRTSLRIDDAAVWTAPPLHATLGVGVAVGLP